MCGKVLVCVCVSCVCVLCVFVCVVLELLVVEDALRKLFSLLQHVVWSL